MWNPRDRIIARQIVPRADEGFFLLPRGFSVKPRSLRVGNDVVILISMLIQRMRRRESRRG